MVDAALEQQVRRLSKAAFRRQPVGVFKQRRRRRPVGCPLRRLVRLPRPAGVEQRADHPEPQHHQDGQHRQRDPQGPHNRPRHAQKFADG
jgi:hypothetical protein